MRPPVQAKPTFPSYAQCARAWRGGHVRFFLLFFGSKRQACSLQAVHKTRNTARIKMEVSPNVLTYKGT